MQQIERTIAAFIVQNFLFGNETEAPAPEDSFMETGLIDSTGILELISFVEDEYGIAVADEDLTPENLDSVRKLSTYIKRRKNGAS